MSGALVGSDCAACVVPASPGNSLRAVKLGADSMLHWSDASGALGDGSALSTAQFLTAAGHSHRFYHAKDGPWAHRALGFLVERRTKDGMFADSAGADPLLTTR